MPAGTIGTFLMSARLLRKGVTEFTEAQRATVELSRYRCFLLGLPQDLLGETLRDIRALAEAGVLPAFQSNRAELSVNQRRAAVLHADLDLRRDMRLVKIFMNSPDLPLDRQVLLKPISALELRALLLDPARLRFRTLRRGALSKCRAGRNRFRESEPR